MRIVFFSAILVLISFSAIVAQTGTIKGEVVEKSNSEPIPFANIVLEGTELGVSTDIYGRFSINAPAGIYNVSFSFIGYQSVKQHNIELKAGETIMLKQDMEVSSSQLAEVEIVTRADRESQAALLLDRKEAAGLVQNIGSGALRKTGASDVASGVTKVVGVSVMGGGNLFVRGMGDRYNSAYLNGMPVASPDPDLKVISLDIFPSGIVQNLTVQKSFTPNLFGDFSGGAINISTKDYPSQKTLQVKIGGGFNSQSTFKEVNSYEGSELDYLGMSGDSRDRPNGVLPDEKEDFYFSEQGEGNPFPENFNMTSKTAPVNTSFSILAGDFLKSEKKANRGLGYLLMASHRYNTEYQKGYYRLINAQDEYRIDYSFNNSVVNTNSSALGAVSYQFNSNHKISYDVLYVKLTSDQTRETFGYHFDYDPYIYTTRFTYRENTLISNQLSGEHRFLDNDRLQLRWWASSNLAYYEEPDRRQLVWWYNPEQVPEGNLSINTRDVNDNHRFYSALDENEMNYKGELDYVLAYDKLDAQNSKLDVTLGFDYKTKTRNFDYWQYNFKAAGGGFSNGIDVEDPDAAFNDENLNNGSYAIEEKIDPASNYVAGLNIMAGYGMVNYNINPILKVIMGLRIENGYQFIDYQEQNTGREQTESINSLALLPSVGVNYDLDADNSMRFSASRTISRPGFREVAPFQYIDFFAGRQSQGNPELINGTNYNADIRWENYPTPGEIYSVSLFGKYLQDPIERVLVATPSGQLESFVNNNSGIVAGVELEVLKSMSTLFGERSFFSDFDVAFNASYLFTEVKIDTSLTVKGASIIPTNKTRPLQGASPYLVNFDLNYGNDINDDMSYNTSLSYNVFGKRLYAAGGQGIGDVYELPRNTLNLTLGLNAGKHWNFSLRIRNLLNAEVVQEQQPATENPERELIVNSFRRGAQVSLGITYDFFAQP